MDDTINRKLAIDELIKMLVDCFQADEELVDAVVTTIKDLPAAEPNLQSTCNKLATDTISRAAAIEAMDGFNACGYVEEPFERLEKALKEIPAAQPTLYGYEIEHLAYIARVMQKEGVTAEYAVRTFGDVSRASRMIIEELQEKVEKSLSAMQLPSAEPEIIRCKDCKHWKDSDGVYRRGIGAESKCPVNIRAVYEGNFYCADAERRTDEQTVSE